MEILWINLLQLFLKSAIAALSVATAVMLYDALCEHERDRIWPRVRHGIERLFWRHRARKAGVLR